MDSSEVTLQESGDEAELQVKGFISESCSLFNFDLSKYKLVVIDFEQATFINSLGIRLWIDWFKGDKVPLTTKVKLKNCVPSVVSQFNMIRGFISENCEVISVYANYYIEDSSEEERVLLTKGEHFMPEQKGEPGWVKIADEIPHSDGQVLILDTIKEKYFMFLGKVKFQQL